MKLLLATGNTHKIEEILAVFNIDGIDFVTLKEFEYLPGIIEDRGTFAGNSAKKAVTLARAAGLLAMADDSGLEVSALDGNPGVHSARYAGTHGDDAANNSKLLRELRDVADRSARFCCAITLATPDGEFGCVEGVCEGRIALEPTGDNGFGYDPLFIPLGYEQSFAELGADVKNRISHRAHALKKAHAAWSQKLTLGESPV